jgi:pimeloyl-ACP methyl ester carboxylesterase
VRVSRLVLLPGMDGTGELFAPLLAALPSALSVTIVRYPDRPANYPEHEALARARLPRDAPFVLLGESFSGPVAVAIAAAAPANLAGIVLGASFLTCPHPLLRVLRPLAALASPRLVPSFIASRWLLGRFATPALRAAHARALHGVSSGTLTARLRAMSDLDVRPQMRAARIPALYLRATEDRIVAARFADEFVAHAASGAVVDIEGPHLLLQADPAAAARHLQAFIDDLARGARLRGSPP